MNLLTASQWFVPEIVKAGDERLKPVQREKRFGHL